MFQIIGIIVVIAMVFGGFVFAGGNLEPVLEAGPHEMIIIGGAGAGAFLIGNSFKTVIASGKGIGKIMPARSGRRRITPTCCRCCSC